MPWSSTRQGGTAAKYRTAEHRQTRARYIAALKAAGTTVCAQPVCVMPSRVIHYGDPVHLGHDDTGSYYLGLVHPACNVKDGARRGNRRSRGADRPRRLEL